jgi:hypothetical protein
LTYEEKTREQTTRAHPKQTGKKVGDHAHFRSTLSFPLGALG